MQEMSGVVDVAIGLLFVYGVLGLVCAMLAALVETALLNERGKTLCRGLFELFGGDRHAEQAVALLEKFYNNPLIYGLYRHDLKLSKKQRSGVTQLALPDNLPAYIAPDTFALAFVAELLGGQAYTAANLTQQLETTPLLSDSSRQSLTMLLAAANDDLNGFMMQLENGYRGMTEQAAGWYKNHSQRVMLVIALLIAVLGNVDSVTIAKSLMVDDALRKELVAAAGQYAKIGAEPSPALIEKRKAVAQLKDEIETLTGDGQQQDRLKDKQAELERARAELAELKQDVCKSQALGPKQCHAVQMQRIAALNRLGLPIGWQSDDPRNRLCCANWLEKLLGWLVTALVVAASAAMWSELLNRCRHTVRR